MGKYDFINQGIPKSEKTLFKCHFCFVFQRPPSSSLSGYGHGLDDVRSPGSGGGTPRLMPPGSHLSGDNISEAGRTYLI